MSHNQQIERICVTCGKNFRVSPSKVNNNRGKYCSRTCLYRSDVMKNVAINMGKNNKGKQKHPFVQAHKDKIKAFQLAKHKKVLCNTMKTNEWGERVKCKNYRDRNARRCKEGHKIPRRYFQSKINKEVYLDIQA